MSNEKVVEAKKPGIWPSWPRVPAWCWGITIFNWLVWLFGAFDWTVVLVLGPVIIDEWSLSAPTWTLMLAFFYWVRGAFAVPGAAISDKIGSGYKRRYTWGIAAVTYSFLSLLTAFKSISLTIMRFFWLRLGVQAGGGVEETVRVAVISEAWPDEHRGFALGLSHTGFPVGSLFAGLVASWVLMTYGSINWRYVFFFTLLTFPPFIVYYLLSSKKGYEKAYAEFDRRGLTKPSFGEMEKGEKGISLVLRTLKIRNVQSIAINHSIFLGVWTMFMSYFPKYLVEIRGFNFAQVARLVVVWTLTGALFQFLLPWWSDRLGRKRILTFAALWMGLVMLCLPFTTTLLLVILVQVAYGFVLNAVYPMLYGMAAESSEKGAVATAVSIPAFCSLVFGGLLPLLVSPLIGIFGGWGVARGYIWIFYIMAALCFIAAAVQHWRTTETAILAKK